MRSSKTRLKHTVLTNDQSMNTTTALTLSDVPILVVSVGNGNLSLVAGMDEKIAFRCGDGHEWLTSPSNLVYKNVSSVQSRPSTLCPGLLLTLQVRRLRLTPIFPPTAVDVCLAMYSEP